MPPRKGKIEMNNKEINNIKIKDIIPVLTKDTLPESYWILLNNAKDNCQMLIKNGIIDSNSIFRLFEKEKDANSISEKIGIDKQYLNAVYNLLKFHRYKPFSLNKIASIKKEYIESLKGIGIKYNGELLINCSTKLKRYEILTQTNISEKELNNIICISDLIRKSCLKEIKALLFMKLGIKSLYELGHKDPMIFREEIKKIIEKDKMKRAIPTEKEIKSDISWAKIYPIIAKE
jgi:hypothetical protein